MNKQNISLALSIVSILMLGALAFFGSGTTVVERVVESNSSLGASNNATSTITNPFDFNQGVMISAAGLAGNAGDLVTNWGNGKCNLNFNNVPAAIAATSTITVDCQATNMLGTATAAQAALPDVTTEDRVFLTMPTTTPTTYQGLTVLSANASSTPGYITLKLFNGTGASFTPGTTTAAGVQYTAIR